MEEDQLVAVLKNQDRINQELTEAVKKLSGSNQVRSEDIAHHLEICPECTASINRKIDNRLTEKGIKADEEDEEDESESDEEEEES